MLSNQDMNLLRGDQKARILRGQQGSMAWILVLLIAIGGALGVAYIYRDMLGQTKLGQILHLKTTSPSKEIYYCPMHPQYHSDRPGTCPICNMTLEKLTPEKEAELKSQTTAEPQTAAGTEKKGEKLPAKKEPARSPETHVAAESESSAGKRILYWTDPMIPGFKSDKPGKSPMGMDLIPVYAEEPSSGKVLPPGTVRIAPQTQQLIGVEYGVVEEQPLSKTILTVGRLAYDETKIARIQTKIDGWIENVFVDFTGMLVKKGQPLFSLYSPELFSAQQELLIAKKTMEALAGSEFRDVSANAESLYNSTRERLRLWNVTDGEIKQIENRGAPIRALTFYSPINGFVLTRNAYPGQRIAPDTELYSIADLSTVWVLADIFEYEVANIRLGQKATMTLPSYPGETFTGAVSYIYPGLDNTSRTLKVRLQFPNSNFKLKPDMWANVTLTIDYGRQLSVPGSAVLDSGTEQIVFVALGDGYFEPRKIEVGAQVDSRYIVLSGLQRGEKIVTSGNFLIDSESKLKSALSDMGRPGHAEHGGSSPTGGGQKDQGSMQPEATPGGQAGHAGHN